LKLALVDDSCQGQEELTLYSRQLEKPIFNNTYTTNATCPDMHHKKNKKLNAFILLPMEENYITTKMSSLS
jgi:hypothetical protein